MDLTGYRQREATAPMSGCVAFAISNLFRLFNSEFSSRCRAARPAQRLARSVFCLPNAVKSIQGADCLLGPDPDEKLARYLDAVRLFELAPLVLNFRPRLVTLG